MLLNLVTPLHESTKRDYKERLLDNKIEAMVEARKFEENFWDGPRRYGYGGYKYDGRWRSVAARMIKRYDLKPGDSVMDLGCGKGFLLYELQKLMPKLRLAGVDRSRHAIDNAHPELDAELTCSKIENLDSWTGHYTLIVSLGTLHNLTLRSLAVVLPRIQQRADKAYIMVESFRDEAEWYNLTAWCLTAETIMRPEDWGFLFEQARYAGDYEYIFFK